MSRKTASAHTVNIWISELPDLLFDGTELHCNVCEVRLSVTRKSDVTKDVCLKTHIELKHFGGRKQKRFNLDFSAQRIQQKMNNVLNSNPCFSTFSCIGKLLRYQEVDCSDPNINTSSLRHHPLYKYAPITSADIERTFSVYKWIFSDTRHRYTPDHFEQILIIYLYYNSAAVCKWDIYCVLFVFQYIYLSKLHLCLV